MTSRVFKALGLAVAWSLMGCLTAALGPERPTTFAKPPEVAQPIPEAKVTWLKLGTSRAPKCAAAGEASCLSRVDSVHGAFLVQHPRGTFLIDSGLSEKGKDDLKRFGFTIRQLFDFDVAARERHALALRSRRSQ